MAFASITITLWFGAYEVMQGQLTAGGLVAYLVYTMMVAAPIATLAGLYARFQAAIGATERLFDLLDTAPDIVSPAQRAGAAGRYRRGGVCRCELCLHNGRCCSQKR
ncbi:MAG: hypothetical protein M5U34_09400 [Chloroflexi bacterium]|nr:hypothetical protein [Chloroflexota bacterium]